MSEIHYGIISTADLGARTGLAYFEDVVAKRLPHPPIAKLMGMRFVYAEAGKVRLECRVPETAVNPMGAVHGGFAMTVLDSALGCAAHSMLPAGRGYTTIEAKVNMTRPVPMNETLYCSGEVLTMGRRVATSEARLEDGQGRLLAFGTSSLLVYDV